MPNPISTRTRAAALTLAALALAGCHQADISGRHVFRPDHRFQVDWSPEQVDLAGPVAFDITNQRGSVWVEVDETIDAPEIMARVSWDIGDRTVRWEGPESGGVSAEVESGEIGDVVNIAARLPEGAPVTAFVDLRVRTPRCDGIRVQNDGGAIVLVGVSGGITAMNGLGAGDVGGRIELRTSHPITEPVALVSQRGPVSAVLGPGGRGLIELDSEDNRAEFESRFGAVTNVRPGVGTYRGVWNDGSNPIIARTGGGRVHVQVQDNPEMFSVADDWLALIRD